MPTYVYECNSCNFAVEIVQGYHDPPLLHCDNCNSDNLRRCITSPIVFIRNPPKTLGHLASRNREKMGKYELEAKEQLLPEHKRENYKPEIPWWRKDNKVDTSLSNLTPEQTKKYVETGEKP